MQNTGRVPCLCFSGTYLVWHSLKDALRIGYWAGRTPLGGPPYSKFMRDEMFFVQETLSFFERLDDLQFNALQKNDFDSQNKNMVRCAIKKSWDFEVIFE